MDKMIVVGEREHLNAKYQAQFYKAMLFLSVGLMVALTVAVGPVLVERERGIAERVNVAVDLRP
jgi:hypothetical protein